MKDLILLNDNELKKILSKKHAYDIAELIIDSSPNMQMRIIRLISLSQLVDVFKELPFELSSFYFNLLNENYKRQVLNDFEMDELKIFVDTFDQEIKPYILSLLTPMKRTALEKLMSYDETKIASIMTTEFLVIKSTMSIKEATSYIIEKSKENDYIDEIFVLSEDDKLIGSITLKNLITAREKDRLETIIFKTTQTLNVNDSLDKSFKIFRQYGKNVLAVTDSDMKLVGIVTADDILEQMIDENEEDIEKLISVGDYDEDSKPLTRAKQRLPWLLMSVILNLVIAFVLDIFEATLDQVIALILFQPMILGMAGNIGTQSIAVTILKLNSSDLDERSKVKKHMLKELSIGFLNSLITGILGFIFALVILSIVPIGSQEPRMLSFVIGVSLFGGMLISALAGILIPLTLDKLKIDPAAASGPIISTINDFFALIIYFGIATIMFVS